MSQYISTVAVILKAQDYKEFDQLLTIYTKEQGKMTVLAKGVKKNASKLRGGIQLFSQTQLTMVAGKAFPIVINAESMDTFAAIRSDFARVSYTSYIMELVDKVIVDSEQDDQMFLLLVQGLNLLAYISPWIATKMIEIRLLNRLGYELDTDYCNHCKILIEPKETVKGIYGGIVCNNCLASFEDFNGLLSVEARTVMTAFREFALVNLDRIYVSTSCQKQLDAYFDFQWAHILEQRLKTKEFLRQMM